MIPRAILFVCTGNTCRSPLAEMMLRHMLKKEGISGMDVFSRGIGVRGSMPMSELAMDALKAAGIESDPHESKAISQADIDRADWVIVMTSQHRRILLKDYPNAKGKVRMLSPADIEDPIGGSPKDFEKCRIDIQNALLDLLPKIKSKEGHPS